jgi:hypothetical protein
MTRDELLALLRKLEWPDNSGGEYAVRCHACGGYEPECELVKAISWLEDEDNATEIGTTDVWVLR